MIARLLIPALSLLAAGCATYRPLPLETDLSALSPPVAAVLARDTSTLSRPYLTPATIDLAGPLDPNGIATVTVLSNPDLRAQRVRLGVTGAQVFAAGLLPDPTFSFGVADVVSGPDPLLEIASALGFDLNALRTRRVDLARARATIAQVRLDLAWAEWQAAGQARLQAVRVTGFERAAELASRSSAIARSLLDRTLAAAGRGDLSADRVQVAQLAAFQAQDRQRQARRDLIAARSELSRLIGLPPDLTLTLAPLSPYAGPLPTGERLFVIAQAERTDLRALEAGYRAQEAAVHKAVLDQFPSLLLTVNATRDTAGNLIVGPAVDFTLPLWNRNRGGIALERATRAALKAEYEGRLFQARAEIAAALAGIELAREQRDEVLVTLPPLRRFAEATARAAERGDLALATAQAAEQSLLDQQILLAQSEELIAEQLVALELLTGTLRERWTP